MARYRKRRADLATFGHHGGAGRLLERDVLDLDAVAADKFRGVSPRRPSEPRVFGGQVAAQALAAACRSVEDRPCHSLHGYFIRPGDPNRPILYEVERTCDGQGFSMRRVVATQAGRQIFHLSASFQATEAGLEHQAIAPTTLGPEYFLSDEALSPPADDLASTPNFIELRPVNPLGGTLGDDQAYRFWMRCRLRLDDDPLRNQCMLTYATDLNLVDTALRLHGGPFAHGPGLQAASLDHAVWFHRPCRLNDWHLYVQDSPSASGGRGFSRGSIYDAAGRLIASTAQESLIRVR